MKNFKIFMWILGTFLGTVIGCGGLLLSIISIIYIGASLGRDGFSMFMVSIGLAIAGIVTMFILLDHQPIIKGKNLLDYWEC